jgi:integrase
VANPPLPEKGDRVIYWDSAVVGLGLVVTADGHCRFAVQYRAGSQSRRMSLKAGLTLMDARRETKAILGMVARGGDPLGDKRKAAKAATTTLKTVAEDYLRREGNKLRTRRQREFNLERLVFPALGSRQIDTIKRSEIVRLLDCIEDGSGPHMAQKVLSHLSRIFTWHASRDDDFLSPIRRGMARTKMREHARDRILSDDELRAVWKAAEAFPAPYGPLVRFVLLTATRRAEAACMARGELFGDDWIIPASRMKAKVEHVIPLSRAAKAVLRELPVQGSFVFSLDGGRPTCNFAAYKARLDTISGVAGWRLHDLRRTARSLMSRAGVAPDVAERCLAHALGGVRGTYDRHSFHSEKAHAFEALASLIERTVNPTDNVVAMPDRQAAVH